MLAYPVFVKVINAGFGQPQTIRRRLLLKCSTENLKFGLW